MRAVAIVQARMGSSRLPGKALVELAGMPVLGHVLTRLQRSQELDEIVVATTEEPEDDALEAYVRGLGIRVVRGSRDNVLARFLQAAEETQADLIARITGDAPLVDSIILDRWLGALRRSGAEAVRTVPSRRMIDEGMAVFSRSALERLGREAADDPVAREHVNAWYRDRKDELELCEVAADPSHFFRGARLSVDTPADLRFLEEVHRALGARATEVDVADLVQLLRSRPELLQINDFVRQKSPDEVTRRVLVYPGSLEAARDLATHLRDRQSMGVLMVLPPGADVEGCGIPVLEWVPGSTSWKELCRSEAADALVVVDGPPRAGSACSIDAECPVFHWGQACDKPEHVHLEASLSLAQAAESVAGWFTRRAAA